LGFRDPGGAPVDVDAGCSAKGGRTGGRREGQP